MKVRDERSSSKRIPWDDIEAGTCFIRNGDIYIADDDGGATKLSDGMHLTVMVDGDGYEVVDAEVVVLGAKASRRR
jgi:hypothetical protein